MTKRWTTANERFAYFQRALVLYEEPGRTYVEVALILGLSVERVRQIIREARVQRDQGGK